MGFPDCFGPKVSVDGCESVVETVLFVLWETDDNVGREEVDDTVEESLDK